MSLHVIFELNARSSACWHVHKRKCVEVLRPGIDVVFVVIMCQKSSYRADASEFNQTVYVLVWNSRNPKRMDAQPPRMKQRAPLEAPGARPHDRRPGEDPGRRTRPPAWQQGARHR